MDVLVAKVALAMFCINASLTGIKVVIDGLLVKFPQLQRADNLLGTILGYSSKIIGLLSANTQAQPAAPAQPKA